MQCFPEEIRTAKPKLDEKIYYRKDEYLTMSYKQKKTQTKQLVMLSIFCGAFDVPHRKKNNKIIPAMVDFYNQSMGSVDSADQVLYSYAFERSYTFERKSKSWAKESCLQPFVTPLDELLCNWGESGVVALVKKQDCVVCSDLKTNSRKRSSYACKVCHLGCHPNVSSNTQVKTKDKCK